MENKMFGWEKKGEKVSQERMLADKTKTEGRSVKEVDENREHGNG